MLGLFAGGHAGFTDAILEHLPKLRRNFRELRIFVVIGRIVAFDIRQIDDDGAQLRQIIVVFERADPAAAAARNFDSAKALSSRESTM